MATAAQQLDLPPEAVDFIYARSLFDLAESTGGRATLEEVADEMDQLRELALEHPRLGELLRSRIVTASDKVQVLHKIFAGRVSKLFLNFLLLLARRERLDRGWRIVGAYHQLIQERFGRIEVDVYTRFPIPPAELEALRERIKSRLNRDPIMHAYIDEGMIGGVKFQVGDKLVDASLSTRLRRMREQLIEGGSNAVRARADRIIEEKP